MPGEHGLKEILPPATAAAWRLLAPALPADCWLGGGTALAVHFAHRVSRDLDFFYADESLNLDTLEDDLRGRGDLAVEVRGAGTLNGVFAKTKIQFLCAAGQVNVAEPSVVDGIAVLGLRDVAAMKVNAIGGRAALRDYYDLKILEQAGYLFEEGLGLYMARYGVRPQDASIRHIVKSLSYFDDVDEDETLPESKAQISAYWTQRQAEVERNASRYA